VAENRGGGLNLWELDINCGHLTKASRLGFLHSSVNHSPVTIPPRKVSTPLHPMWSRAKKHIFLSWKTAWTIAH
jgi:hypothetical protein